MLHPYIKQLTSLVHRIKHAACSTKSTNTLSTTVLTELFVIHTSRSVKSTKATLLYLLFKIIVIMLRNRKLAKTIKHLFQRENSYKELDCVCEEDSLQMKIENIYKTSSYLSKETEDREASVLLSTPNQGCPNKANTLESTKLRQRRNGLGEDAIMYELKVLKCVILAKVMDDWF